MGEAPDTSKENKYVRSVTLSGEALDRVWLQREDLSRDGHLVLGMGDGLSEWGRDDKLTSVSSPDDGAPE
jgi:putative alpha-1,2-mannosidase